MNRSLGLLVVFVLFLPGCGHYGPPERRDGQQDSPAEAAETEDPEETEERE